MSEQDKDKCKEEAPEAAENTETEPPTETSPALPPTKDADKPLDQISATIGEVGNAEQSNINWGKAGRMRWKGKRPTVRGVAMNPIDHPHGGGEGKTSGGRHPVSPWGKPEGRTRKRKASDAQIIRRRKTGKGRK